MVIARNELNYCVALHRAVFNLAVTSREIAVCHFQSEIAGREETRGDCVIAISFASIATGRIDRASYTGFLAPGRFTN